DISLQYIIRNSIGVLQMKNTADSPNYIAHHSTLCEQLIRMSATYPDNDTIYHLLHGFPYTASWSQFEVLLHQHIQTLSL
ncbi:hypothetical protein C8R48DRAFT_608745, partial [Suillus tomentosus]